MSESSKSRIIETASELFSRHGFNAVGLDRIIAEVGVTKTTFYNHFASKDDLIIAVIKHRDAIETEEMIRDVRARAGEDGRASLLAIFDVFNEWFHTTEFRGCMFMNAAMEFPSENDPIHIAASGHSRHLMGFLRDCAERAGAPDPEMIATKLCVLLTGALVSRQIWHQLDAAIPAREAAEQLLDQSLREYSSS